MLDGDNSTVEGYDVVCGFSPTTAVEECLILPPHAFENGKMVRRHSLSKSLEFDFPAPVGALKVWNVDHEEAQLMPIYLGDKGLENANFYIALDEAFVNLLLAWRMLGFDHNKEIEFEGARFRPLDLIVSRLPKPMDLIGKLHGYVCVGTLAEGVIAGRRVRRFMYQMTSHEEVAAKYGVQGVGYQTGVPAACAAMMLAKGMIGERGVIAPGAPRRASVHRADGGHGTPWAVVDLPPEDELPICVSADDHWYVRGGHDGRGSAHHQHPPVHGGGDDLHLRLVGRLRHRGHGAVLGPGPDTAHARPAAGVLGAAHGAGVLGARLGAAARRRVLRLDTRAHWASSGASSAAGGRGPANGSTRPCTSRSWRATSAPGGRSSTAMSSG